MAWTFNKGTAYVASPILYGDYLYLLADNGAITCLDAKTGAVKYEGGRPPEAWPLHGVAGRVRRQDL